MLLLTCAWVVLIRLEMLWGMGLGDDLGGLGFLTLQFVEEILVEMLQGIFFEFVDIEFVGILEETVLEFVETIVTFLEFVEILGDILEEIILEFVEILEEILEAIILEFVETLTFLEFVDTIEGGFLEFVEILEEILEEMILEFVETLTFLELVGTLEELFDAEVEYELEVVARTGSVLVPEDAD